MSEHKLVKQYLNQIGLDLKASDLNRPKKYASLIKNAKYRKSGAIEKRQGFQGYAKTQGGFGLFTYNRISPSTNLLDQRVLAVDENVFHLLETTITVTYTGLDPSALITVFYDVDSSQYRCQVEEGGTVLLDQALEVGIDDATPYTMNSLKTAIDALANFGATITGDTSTPAAFIKTIRDWDLNGQDATLKAGYWSQVNSPIVDPFNGSDTNKNASNFENISSIQLNNVIYFANGYDDTLKFDGQNLYRAGLPTPGAVTSAPGGAGAVTGTNYFHKVQHIQYDAVGNIVEGNNSITSSGLNPVAQSMDVTVPNIVAASGFNTNCAIVNGAQVGVNVITVDDGSGGAHTMKVGDTAYFYDGVAAAYTTRSVLAVTPTTVQISGANVNVLDNAVISNNLRTAIYRNESSATTPSIFYLLEEIPNNSFAATQVYNDNIPDASLGALFIEPVADRSPPPKGKYISKFRNRLVIAGSIESPRTVFYSDVDGCEYFPLDDNQLPVEGPDGEVITGIAPNNEVFAVFTARSIDIISGDIEQDNIRVDRLTIDIGCAAHATITEAQGALYFLYKKGPFKMIGGQLPTPLGESVVGGGRIEPAFDQMGLSDDQLLKLKRAIGFNDRFNELYWLYVPAETSTAGSVHPNDFTTIFAYDYNRDAWLIWDSINLAGGICQTETDTYFIERRYNGDLAQMRYHLYRLHNNDDSFDYQDNDAAIDFQYAPQWEDLEEPALLKRFLAIRILSLEQLKNNDLNVETDVEVNYVYDVSVANFTFSFPAGGYGVSAYSTSPYGDPAENISKHKLGNSRAKALRPIFKNDNDQENVIISGWELEVDATYRKHFKT